MCRVPDILISYRKTLILVGLLASLTAHSASLQLPEDSSKLILIELYAGAGASLVSINQGSNGSVVQSSYNSITYTPQANFCGSDMFVFRTKKFFNHRPWDLRAAPSIPLVAEPATLDSTKAIDATSDSDMNGSYETTGTYVYSNTTVNVTVNCVNDLRKRQLQHTFLKSLTQ